MTSWRQHPAQTASGFGWARRVVLQQLDALTRLAAIAWRLIDPPQAPRVASASVAGVMAGVRGIETAVRLHARVAWALRLIAALRARLHAELQDADSGRAAAPATEARDVPGDLEPSALSAAPTPADRVERPERAERPERLERERFGFERRHSEDEFAEILQRPAAEIIALICRELGLSEDWPRLAEEAWAREDADGDEAEPLSPPAPPPSSAVSWIAPAPS